MVMKYNNGLTVSMIFDAESANYGEGFGNISSLKKVTRGDGNAYSYISRQALRYNMIQQLGWDDKNSLYKKDKKTAIQFTISAQIDKYPEIDLFGYMKTIKDDKAFTRSAVVRLSNAVALESFCADMDFLTNMGFAKRIGKDNSIAQSEIHRSLYAYTITIDLDRIGIDGDIVVPESERAERVKAFLNTVKVLYRDIKGRRENLAPLFAIGGTYPCKNPFFENRLSLRSGVLELDKILDTIASDKQVAENTAVGYVRGTFKNEADILERLHPVGIGTFFEGLCKRVDEYYG